MFFVRTKSQEKGRGDFDSKFVCVCVCFFFFFNFYCVVNGENNEMGNGN